MSFLTSRTAAVAALVCFLSAAASQAQLHTSGAARPAQASTRTAKPAFIRAALVRRLPDDADPIDAETIDPAPHPQRVTGLTLSELEQMAMANNPATAVAQAQVDAAGGNWLQVGLKPNPVVGYIGDDIGADGSAGAQGAFIRQEFVRGHKLELNRQVAAFATARAEAEWDAASMRVMTDVRTLFYRALLAQRRLDLATELAKVAEKAAGTAKRLWDLREGRRVDYLRARIDADRMNLAAHEANTGHVAAWRELATVVGLPNLNRQALQGDLDDDLPELEFDIVAQQLISGSPPIVAARADIDRASWAISRAEAEPIPNLLAGIEVKHDTASDDVLVAVTAGFQLPIWNRNEGGIQQSYGEHAVAVARLQQLELQLRRELAAEFRTYDAARMKALRFAQGIVPNSRTAVELVEAGLAAGELSYLDLLTARRALFQANLEYIDALEALWISSQRIDGMLLSGSLNAQ